MPVQQKPDVRKAKLLAVRAGAAAAGGPPAGPAGGVLAGTYPNPDFDTTPETLSIHVSEVTGNDVTGDGSALAPWKTLARAYKSFGAFSELDIAALVPSPSVLLTYNEDAAASVDRFVLRAMAAPGTLLVQGVPRVVHTGTFTAVTPLLDTPIAITDATNANPIVVRTATAHGRLTGSRVSIAGVGGNLAANVTGARVTFVDATHFSIDGVAGTGVYTSGGLLLTTPPMVEDTALPAADSWSTFVYAGGVGFVDLRIVDTTLGIESTVIRDMDLDGVAPIAKTARCRAFYLSSDIGGTRGAPAVGDTYQITVQPKLNLDHCYFAEAAGANNATTAELALDLLTLVKARANGDAFFSTDLAFVTVSRCTIDADVFVGSQCTTNLVIEGCHFVKALVVDRGAHPDFRNCSWMLNDPIDGQAFPILEGLTRLFHDCMFATRTGFAGTTLYLKPGAAVEIQGALWLDNVGHASSACVLDDNAVIVGKAGARICGGYGSGRSVIPFVIGLGAKVDLTDNGGLTAVQAFGLQYSGASLATFTGMGTGQGTALQLKGSYTLPMNVTAAALDPAISSLGFGGAAFGLAGAVIAISFAASDAPLPVSAWTPADLPSLILLFDPVSQNVGSVGDLNPISQFLDTSGTNDHLVQAGAARPIWHAVGVNGNSFVRSSATQWFNASFLPAQFTNAKNGLGFTFFAVFNSSAGAGAFAAISNFGGLYLYANLPASGFWGTYGAGQTPSSQTDRGALKLLIYSSRIVQIGTAVDFYTESAGTTLLEDVGANPGGYAVSGDFSVLAENAAGASPAIGDLYFYGCTLGPIDTDNIVQLVRYSRARWNV